MDDLRAQEWLAAARKALSVGKPAHAIKAAERAIESGAARASAELLRGRALIALGRRAEAVALLESHEHVSVAAAAIAARTLVAEGEVLAGVQLAARLAAQGHEHPMMHEALASAGRVGWTHEAIAACEALVKWSGGRAEELLRAAQLAEWLHDLDRADAYAERATTRDPSSIEAWVVRARVLAKRERQAEAQAAAARASTLAVDDPVRLAMTAQAHLAAGDVLAAEADQHRILRLAPGDPTARARIAELALWRMDLDGAERRAREVVHDVPAHALALTVLGGVYALRDRLVDSLALLDRALAAEPTSFPALHFRGEVRRRLGRHVDARADLDLAIARAEGYAFVAQANRLLDVIEEAPSGQPYSTDTYVDLVASLEPLAGAPDADTRAGLARGLRPYLSRAITASGGNRTSTPTRWIDGRIEPVPVRLNARAAARLVQERLKFEPPDAVLARFDDLVVARGEWPTIHCHRGEVLLWLGRYDEAVRAFERALEMDRTTRWGWIGLTASLLMRGDLEASDRAARSAFVAPPPGRTLYVYRTELFLRLGRLDEAEADLATTRHMNPERFATHLLEAELAGAKGEGERAARALAEARRHAPAFFGDLSRAGGAEGDPATTARAALRMMRGNRSASFVSYFTHDGTLRFVPGPSVEAVRLG